jgi:cytochrome c1
VAAARSRDTAAGPAIRFQGSRGLALAWVRRCPAWRAAPELAGNLPNTPENLVRWIRQPQTIKPGNVMPDLGIGVRDARDIAAYLYTLR